MIKYIIAGLIGILALFYAVVLISDLIKNRGRIKDDPGSPLLIGIAGPIVLFLASMGVSDIVINTLFFKKCNIVDDKLLPGTLIASGTLPLAVVAIVYLLSSEVDLKIVLVVAICQAVGAALGVHIVAGLNGAVIKKAIGAAMLATAVFLFLKLVGVGTTGGALTTFPIGKLIFCGVCAFILGALNMLGMGIKAPTMSLLLTLGLASGSVLPVIMTACSFSAVSGGVQFVKRDLYHRKVTLLYSTAGFIGAILGIVFVVNLPATALQIIMLLITVYTGFDMLFSKKKAK